MGDLNNSDATTNEGEGWNAAQIQQQYFLNLPDCDWVKYSISDRNALMQNIAYALFGSPSAEGDLTQKKEQTPYLTGYTSRQVERVTNIYNKIVEQSKFSRNGEDIVMSVLLVVCARPKPGKFYQITPAEAWVDLHIKTDIELSYSAVFRLRKCIPTTERANACKLYVDENGRVYQSWESYLTDNTQQKCVLIVPENGEYKGEKLEGKEDFLVKLTVTPSPSLGLRARVLSTADTANSLASIGALGVIGASMFTPVGPAVVLGATVATVATGVYGAVRSSLHLHDRKMHQQTISPSDPEARGSWFNIAASTVGVSTCAATGLLARSAAAGNTMTQAGKALSASVNVLRHANLVTGGAGLFHSLWHIIEKYRKHAERPTSLELFQLTASLLFFCNALVSNKTAQEVIEDAQAKTINDYRATLRSNRHRKILDKVSAEARRVRGAVQGNAEVIRGIRSIVDKDQFFADVLRINKEINQHKLRVSLTADGQINLNARYKYNPTELYAMGKEGRAQLFSSIDPVEVVAPNVPTRLNDSGGVLQLAREEDEGAVTVGLHPGEVVRLGGLLLRVTSSGTDEIATTLEHLSRESYDNLMNIAINLLSKMAPEDLRKLKLLSPDEDVIVQCVRFVFNYIQRERPLGEARVTDAGVVAAVKEFFQDGCLRRERILNLKDDFIDWVDMNIYTLKERCPQMAICPTCEGVRYA